MREIKNPERNVFALGALEFVPLKNLFLINDKRFVRLFKIPNELRSVVFDGEHTAHYNIGDRKNVYE